MNYNKFFDILNKFEQRISAKKKSESLTSKEFYLLKTIRTLNTKIAVVQKLLFTEYANSILTPEEFENFRKDWHDWGMNGEVSK